MINNIIKGIMDSMVECRKREIEANAVLINDRMFFSKTLVYPVGYVPMVCGLRAYYSNELPDDVLFAVTHVDGADRKEEVRHGEWVEKTEPLGWSDVNCIECSACGESWITDEELCVDDYKDGWKYCPHCGAKMDGKGEG